MHKHHINRDAVPEVHSSAVDFASLPADVKTFSTDSQYYAMHCLLTDLLMYLKIFTLTNSDNALEPTPLNLI